MSKEKIVIHYSITALSEQKRICGKNEELLPFEMNMGSTKKAFYVDKNFSDNLKEVHLQWRFRETCRSNPSDNLPISSLKDPCGKENS